MKILQGISFFSPALFPPLAISSPFFQPIFRKQLLYDKCYLDINDRRMEEEKQTSSNHKGSKSNYIREREGGRERGREIDI
jgi:hypothetical protein